MSCGFEIGRAYYNRRTDIHARFVGQQQRGTITPANYPFVIIITGEEGLEHGYADRHRSDEQWDLANFKPEYQFVVRQYAIGKGHSVSVLWRGGEVASKPAAVLTGC